MERVPLKGTLFYGGCSLKADYSILMPGYGILKEESTLKSCE